MTSYYSEWRAGQYTCHCGWSGTGHEASYEVLTWGGRLSCPKCDQNFIHINWPTAQQTRAAAAKGNQEAQAELPGIEMREQRQAAREASRASLANLPDLQGDHVDFSLHEIKGDDGFPDWLVLTSGDVEVYREPIAWCDYKAVILIGSALRAKYGERARSLDPEDAPYLFEVDDWEFMPDTSGIEKVQQFLNAEHLAPTHRPWARNYDPTEQSTDTQEHS